MGQLKLTVLVLVLAVTVLVDGQLNGVKRLLTPCYNESALPGISIAENRVPARLNIFLEYLRRLEDANPRLTVREFSALILQRLKQNGIVLSGRVTDLSIGIPYSPLRLEAIKGTFILQQYLTNSSQTLDYGDLDQRDLCTFHYMISNTINTTVRGDESTTCLRSARYQIRFRRDLETYDTTEKTNGADGGDRDTETVERIAPRRLNQNGAEEASSQCPLEQGLIFTNHGTVKIGAALLGLATSYNPENVNGANNIYAATLAGDLTHAALSEARIPLQLGLSGGWNSTISQKYFFLQRNTDLDLTDQDIRSSVDGLLLGSQMDAIKRKYNDIKLSQVLDMYYSPAQSGVFDPSFRACNRNILYSEYISVETLLKEINAYIGPLDDFGQYPSTISDPAETYPRLVDAAINNFTSYFPKIVDLACPQLDAPIERVSTDLLIFLDPNYSFTTVEPILSLILDNIDVNKYGSRYTLFNGDGRNITNSTYHLLDFFKAYNRSTHDLLPREFDYSKIYEVIETTVRSKLNNNTYTGGESTIVLLVTRTPPNDNQKTFLDQRKEIMGQFMPDVSVLVLGSGTAGDYSSVLSNQGRDFISLIENTSENDLRSTAQNVIDRIKTIPRSVVNPNCGSTFGGSANTFTTTQYVDLNSVNYYKIAPNYFSSGGDAKIKITEVSTGSITVCISRDQSRPNNQTSECQTLQSSVQTTEISGWCGGSVQDCAPIYLSVYGNTTQYRCRDYFCRFPDSVKYTISLENVGCASSAAFVMANFFLAAVLFIVLRF